MRLHYNNHQSWDWNGTTGPLGWLLPGFPRGMQRGNFDTVGHQPLYFCLELSPGKERERELFRPTLISVMTCDSQHSVKW